MFKEKFAQNIRRIRKSRKLTQERLAELVGVDFRYISLIENAKSFPSCGMIEKLSFALKSPYSELFDIEDNFSRIDIENSIIEHLKLLDDKDIKILYNFEKQLL